MSFLSRTNLVRATMILGFATKSIAGFAADIPHLELEMSSREYQKLLDAMPQVEDNDPLRAILDMGKRNLDWIDFINATRPDGQKLELSTPATQRGIPITSPSRANRELVMQEWDGVTAALPQQIKDVVVGGADFTANLDISDELFLQHVRLIDRAYQHASRWILQEPYLSAYAARAGDDVRGYYYLTNDPDLNSKLQSYRTLSTEDQAQYKEWLIELCRNNEISLSACESNFQATLARNGNVSQFYRQYLSGAKDHWDSYFNIPETRTDVVWNSSNENEFVIPFRNPNQDNVLNWLKVNIEDEWKWMGWQLKLDFKDEGDDYMTHVEFSPGATPHVNGIAGSVITMDGNRNIDEYSSRWTIRHEYGHVLGFPDCYLEFYDEDAGTMINYQLDTSNLMCSRTGHLKQIHFDALKAAYYQD